MEFNNYNHPDHGCFIGFWPGSGTVGLADDAGDTWPYTGVIATSGTLSNSQCQVNLAWSSYSLSGNNLTVTVSISFFPAFVGTQEIWMLAGDIYNNMND